MATLALLTGSVAENVSGVAAEQRYPWQFPRATVDRPDLDTGAGQQVHVIYMVASDHPDDGLDTMGVLQDSLLSQNHWFIPQSADYGEPARRWRLDRHRFDWTDPASAEVLTVEGVDVAFIQSDKTREELGDINTVENERRAHGFPDSDQKRYLTYVTASSPLKAGIGGYYSAVVWLANGGLPLADGPDSSGFAEKVAQHELLHGSGAVPPEAPHHCAVDSYGGHICATPEVLGTGESQVGTDVMSSGGDTSSSLHDYLLDINRDDYFDHDEDWVDAADDPIFELATLPAVSVADTSVVEGDAGSQELVFDVGLTHLTAEAVTLSYETADGTATAGEDYEHTSGQLMFEPGVVGRQVRVPVRGDTDVEPDETVLLRVTDVTHATVEDGQGTGTIVSDEPPAANQPPTAVAAGPASGDEGQTLAFDGSASADPDGSIASYAWDFGDGTTGSGSQVSHAFADDGSYTVTFTVTDDRGAQDSDTLTVEVANVAPTVVAGGGQDAVAGEPVAFSAETSDPGDDTVTVTWNFGDGSPEQAGHSVSHTYTTPGTYSVTAVADDGDGGSAQDALTVTVADADGGGTTDAGSTTDGDTTDGSGDGGTTDGSTGGSTDGGSDGSTVGGLTSGDDGSTDGGTTDGGTGASSDGGTTAGDTDGSSDGDTTDGTSDGSSSGGAAAPDADRVWGDDRVTTALAVSRRGWSSSGEVVLATGWGFADALAGGGLAAKLDAPLLLTAPGSLSDGIVSELARLGTDRVWLLGGTGAISSEVERDLQARGYRTVRLAGTDRFATAARVAHRVGAPSGRVVLALGAHTQPDRQAWPDALAAGALLGGPGAPDPVLLTATDRLPPATRAALADLGATHVSIIGGPAAISDTVVAELRSVGYRVERLSGSTRYGTSVAVAAAAMNRHPPGTTLPAVFATGQGYPDGLAAGALAARLGAIVVLVPPDDLADSSQVTSFLADHGHRLDPRLVLGGTSAISDTVYDQLGAP